MTSDNVFDLGRMRLSGNQAVAVSMRELSLGLVRPRELLWVLSKEAKVGIINGLGLGLLLGGGGITPGRRPGG